MDNWPLFILLLGFALFLILITLPRQKRARISKLTQRQIAYKAYLSSDHWKSLRAARVLKDGNRCQRCGRRKNLHVHHTNYHNELPYPQGWYACTVRDVVTLCKNCHKAEH